MVVCDSRRHGKTAGANMSTMRDKIRKRKWPFDESTTERAIAPEIGAVLLVAIVLILSILGASVALGFTDELVEPMPAASMDGDLSAEAAGGNVSHNLTLSLDGGQAVPVEKLSVRVSDTGRELPVDRSSVPADGKITASDSVRFGVPNSSVCGADKGSVALEVIYENGEQSYVFSEETYKVEGGQFAIENGQVIPKTNYTAEVKLVGTAMTYGAYGSNVPISSSIQVGSESYDPWPGNVNDWGNPRTKTLTDQSKNEGISVTMHAATGTTVDSSSGGSAVRVLRDGASPPSLGGLGNQADAEAFIQPYIDNGTVTLAENQAIYLFELSGDTDPSLSHVDYQDAVVVVSLTTSDSTVVERTSKDEGTIYCP